MKNTILPPEQQAVVDRLINALVLTEAQEELLRGTINLVFMYGERQGMQIMSKSMIDSIKQ